MDTSTAGAIAVVFIVIVAAAWASRRRTKS